MVFTLVYCAEHYVVDILAGWALAAVVALVVNHLETRPRRTENQRRSPLPNSLEPRSTHLT